MAKKVTLKEKRDDRSPLTAKEIESFQAMIARVGARKTTGCIFLVEQREGAVRENDEIDAEGLIFSNGISKRDLIFNLIERLAPGKLDRMILGIEMVKFLQETE